MVAVVSFTVTMLVLVRVVREVDWSTVTVWSLSVTVILADAASVS